MDTLSLLCARKPTAGNLLCFARTVTITMMIILIICCCWNYYYRAGAKLSQDLTMILCHAGTQISAVNICHRVTGRLVSSASPTRTWSLSIPTRPTRSPLSNYFPWPAPAAVLSKISSTSEAAFFTLLPLFFILSVLACRI